MTYTILIVEYEVSGKTRLDQGWLMYAAYDNENQSVRLKMEGRLGT